MATISSHVLDSVSGDHAAGIRVECYRRESSGSSTLVFDKSANEQGRISETIDIHTGDNGCEYELVFHSNAYFHGSNLADMQQPTLAVIVLRLSMPDSDGTYHLPIMLSPHSYSVWWSGTGF